MARNGDAPGKSTGNRLAARLDRSQLSRSTMPGGGQVFRGPIASRALKALGARAMTLDRSIIVGDDFDASNPEDQALYAHEQYHAERGDGGPGGGGENYHDAEEVAARAVERMTIDSQREGTEAFDATPTTGAGMSSSSERPEAVNQDPDPLTGYRSMRAAGYSHSDVVDELARKVLATVDERNESGHLRARDVKGQWI